MSSSNCCLLNKSGWQKGIIWKIGTQLGPFSRILKSDSVEIDVGQQVILYFIFFYFFFFMLGRIRGKTDTLMFRIQEYSNQSYFSQKCKIRTESAGDRCSSINIILETYQYPFVKPYYSRVSLSSQTRSLYAQMYYLPHCLFRVNGFLLPSLPPFSLPSFFPPFLHSFLSLFLSPFLYFLDVESWCRILFLFFGPKKMLYERIKILI